MNETTNHKASTAVAGRFEPFVMWLFPKTVKRLQFLDGEKTKAYRNYTNYRIFSGTNQRKGLPLAKKNYESCAKFFNANKYWWMRKIPETIDT